MDSAELKSFRRRLLRWYGDQARDLPWRRTRDPYPIWISEIMLQQTTVAAVIPYFERFLARFPTVHALATAEETDVLRLWEGLGYYSRARNLHGAAKLITERHEGTFPNDLATLQSLPGIGRYTAGAIASFAFDLKAPIVEANTLRLYCRLLGYDGDPRSSRGQELLWGFAESLLPTASPGRLNQALMELGATVCTPREPACGSCPVSAHCTSFRDGTHSVIPRLKPRVPVTEVTEVSIAIQKGSQVLLRRRTEKERWAGLWDFVRFEIDDNHQQIDLKQLIESTQQRTGLSIKLGPKAALLKHGVTRYRITLHCFVARRMSGRLKPGDDWRWVSVKTFDEYPLSVTGRQFAKRLQALGASSIIR